MPIATKNNRIIVKNGSVAANCVCCNARQEGACCAGDFCIIRLQSECQGAGLTFKGVGTKCSPNPCGCCGGGESLAASTATIKVRYILDRLYTDGGGCNCWVAGSDEFRCWDYSATFTYIGSGNCDITCSGPVPGMGNQPATARLVFTPSGCRLNIETTWAVGTCVGSFCGGYTPRAGYSFAYAPGQSSYIATYYIWNSEVLNCAVVTDTDTPPPGAELGTKATITVEAMIA